MAEKKVRTKLFKVSGRSKGDLFGSVNGFNYKIRRGVEVEVPRAVAEVLEHSQRQDDLTAARIAAELKAESLISMTDICGILRDKDDPSTLISQITVSEAPQLMREGVISGGMIPKVECCIEAIRRGVSRVFIIDGRIPHAILIETLTDEGIGTMFVSGGNYGQH